MDKLTRPGIVTGCGEGNDLAVHLVLFFQPCTMQNYITWLRICMILVMWQNDMGVFRVDIFVDYYLQGKPLIILQKSSRVFKLDCIQAQPADVHEFY